MSNKLIIGNWKSNGNLKLVDEFVEQISGENVVVAPPHTLLGYLSTKSPKFHIGAQDCSNYQVKPYTGEISAEMLKDLGCRYVIVGHSERRKNSGNDTIADVLRKVNTVIAANLIAVICVSEKYTEELDESMQQLILENKSQVVLAYEPVSAIGTGAVPPMEQISAVLKDLQSKYPGVKTLYGGSVTAQNAKEILATEGVDGVLIGKASLSASEFKTIIEIAAC